MKEINIKIPEGYIIDKENSNLDKGTIAFKKENTLPNTWEEYRNSLSPKNLIMIDTAINHFYCLPDGNRHKYIALFKLEVLRDIYRQGWKPDYTNQEEKHIIIKEFDKIETFWYVTREHYFLSFQSKEIRNKFYNNFKDLIEKAEDLI